MSPSTINGDRVPIRAWANVHELESDAVRQLKAVASLPWVVHLSVGLVERVRPLRRVELKNIGLSTRCTS